MIRYSKSPVRHGETITLVGSARFEDEFKWWTLNLSLNGYIVHTLAAYPSDMGRKDWYTKEQKEMLDMVHERKIDLSKAIVVLNVGNYRGAETEKEIRLATMSGRLVLFLEPQGYEFSALSLLTAAQLEWRKQLCKLNPQCGEAKEDE